MVSQTSQRFYEPETRGRYLGEPLPMAVSRCRGGAKTTQNVSKSHRGMAEVSILENYLLCYVKPPPYCLVWLGLIAHWLVMLVGGMCIKFSQAF